MKTVLVTGASDGIGAETARLFAKNGYNVAVNYNTGKQRAETLAAELEDGGAKVLCVKADVSRSDEVLNMFREIDGVFGGVDVLVNNAGVSSVKMLCDVSEQEWDRTFDVNVKGAYLCSNAAASFMVHNKFGRIINISSVWGIRGASCEVHYSASKASLIGFTKALAKELSLSGITVNCVCPVLIDTKMNAHLSDEELSALYSEIPVGRAGSAAEVANAVLFLADEKSAYITGQTLCVDGGWSL